MKKTEIWANCLVYNEENFLFFAVKSVINFVDKVILWDTGSTDNTKKIISDLSKLYPQKIETKNVGSVDKKSLPRMRQEMLDLSKMADWVIILDGDEIWPEKTIENVTQIIGKVGDEIDAIVVPFYNLVGDIYHHQEKSAGQYRIKNKKGHLQIKAINTHIPKLHVEGEYPLEAYVDDNGTPVQDREKLIFIETPYLHCSHLRRSSQNRKFNKYKMELGIKIPSKFEYPKVLYEDYPTYIRSPWINMPFYIKPGAWAVGMLKKMKRGISEKHK